MKRPALLDLACDSANGFSEYAAIRGFVGHNLLQFTAFEKRCNALRDEAVGDAQFVSAQNTANQTGFTEFHRHLCKLAADDIVIQRQRRAAKAAVDFRTKRSIFLYKGMPYTVFPLN